MALEWHECRPGVALTPWVERYWAIRGSCEEALPNRVLPDGCADVIVDLSAGPHAFAVGPMRSAAVVPLLGAVDLFGVRFRPGAALAFLDAPLQALADREVPLDALCGSLARSLEAVLAEVAPAERMRHAERILHARLDAGHGTTREVETVANAIALLRRARGGAGVREVAIALGVGERWLERAFDRHVGYGPKMLARVVRFQHALRLLDAGTALSWSALAYEAGFADQAHLVREFRALAGLTPGDFAAERRDVGFVQYGDARRAQDGATFP
ncbi:MAG TPA: helix-turn-helix domain-containing protein [Usitatibacter sp.]|nr:helix-turn-helix domain-containing protein [Usitatibacter sp.]